MTQLTGQSDRGLLLTRPALWSQLLTLLAEYYQLAKPRLTLMVAITCFIGFGMGTRHVAASHGLYGALLATVVGTALSCIGAGIYNQVLERKIDSHMRRTMGRSLPAGRISPRHAFFFATVTSVVGVMTLAVLTHTLSSIIAAITIFSYVLIYTPLKRISSASTIVGAVPGALPPVIGYTAATGELDTEAFVLFAVLFIWQLPHFLAIAWLYRHDYARAGLPVLPVVDRDGSRTFRQILAGCVTLLPLGLVPTVIGMSGLAYFCVALVAGMVFLIFAVALVIGRTRRDARALYFASLVYLPTVFSMMLIDSV